MYTPTHTRLPRFTTLLYVRIHTPCMYTHVGSLRFHHNPRVAMDTHHTTAENCLENRRHSRTRVGGRRRAGWCGRHTAFLPTHLLCVRVCLYGPRIPSLSAPSLPVRLPAGVATRLRGCLYVILIDEKTLRYSEKYNRFTKKLVLQRRCRRKIHWKLLSDSSFAIQRRFDSEIFDDQRYWISIVSNEVNLFIIMCSCTLLII